MFTQPMIAPHLFPVRVYYEDTDFSGFVYHAGYLRFLERGRTEFLRSLGVVQSDLRRSGDGLVFVVSRITVNYHKPALMDDALTIATRIQDVRGASMRMSQDVRRGDLVLADAEVTIAAVRGGRAVRLPASLADSLAIAHNTAASL